MNSSGSSEGKGWTRLRDRQRISHRRESTARPDRTRTLDPHAPCACRFIARTVHFYSAMTRALSAVATTCPGAVHWCGFFGGAWLRAPARARRVAWAFFKLWLSLHACRHACSNSARPTNWADMNGIPASACPRHVVSLRLGLLPRRRALDGRCRGFSLHQETPPILLHAQPPPSSSTPHVPATSEGLSRLFASPAIAARTLAASSGRRRTAAPTTAAALLRQSTLPHRLPHRPSTKSKAVYICLEMNSPAM